ncbi:MAG: transposase family protein [Thermomicrobiales bacterium]|nr:transposase family protein [Thermomicrobiales bacterium]
MVAETEVAGTWTFEDVCLWTYCLVDELWVQIAPRCRRPGPTPVCSDAELVTMALVGECCGWDQETETVSRWRQHRDLFPPQPSRTRCNRRRRALQGAINELRRLILGRLDLAADRQCVIDSLPIPVITFHLVPGANRAEWQAHEARFGKVSSKKLTIFGYKLYLLVARNGLILDFVLAPANVVELQVGAELLEEPSDLDAIGDKAYVQRPAGGTVGHREPGAPAHAAPAQPRPVLLGLARAAADQVDRPYPVPLPQPPLGQARRLAHQGVGLPHRAHWPIGLPETRSIRIMCENQPGVSGCATTRFRAP